MFWKIADRPGFLDGLVEELHTLLNTFGGQSSLTEVSKNNLKSLPLTDLAASMFANDEAKPGEDPSAAGGLRQKQHMKAPSLSAIFALLTVFFGLTAFKLAVGSSTKMLGVSDDLNQQLDLHAEKLRMSSGELTDTWDSASDTVKNAFNTYYVPRSLGAAAEPSDLGLTAIEDLINHLTEITFLAKTQTEEMKQAHLRRLQFVVSLCDAARQRIIGLTIMDANSYMPALILGREEGELQHSNGKDFTFNDLLNMLTANGIVYRPPTQPPDQQLPRALVLEFVGLMQMGKIEMDADKFVREQFVEYFTGLGLSLKTLTAGNVEELASLQMPGDPSPFNSKEFFRFLQTSYMSNEPKYAQEHWLDTLARQWTVSSLTKTIRDLKQAHKRRYIQDLERKQEKLFQAREEKIPLTHTFALSTFLI